MKVIDGGPSVWDAAFLTSIAYACLAILDTGDLRLVRQSQNFVAHSQVVFAAPILIGSYTCLYGIFGAFHSRNRLPVEMALLLFAAVTIQFFVEMLRNKANSSPLTQCSF